MTRGKLLYLATEDWYFVSDTLPLARAAKAEGYDVFVAARENGKRSVIADAGLTFLPLRRMSRSSIGPASHIGGILELKELYEKLRPGLVHHIALKPALYGSLAARRITNLPVINSIMGLGYVFASSDLKARAIRPLVSIALARAILQPRSRTLVQNSDDLDDLAKIAPAARDNLRLLQGSGVDHRKFYPTPEPEGPPVIVLPARLLAHKGIAQFVAAARILKSKGIAARFALVGEPDPDNHASVRPAEIAAWISDGLVEHWGFRADMPAVYRSANIVCLPTYYREGLPRVLLEAAASSRAIVATDVPGCREVVAHGVTGWLVKPRDATALAAALEQAIAEPARRLNYATTARQLVETRLSADIIIAATLAIYDEVVAAPV